MTLKTTSLHALHIELGGRMVPFAGWEMPVQFAGVMAEHTHCRDAAALFDVGHMGQVRLDIAPEALEALVPADLVSLPAGRQRYALFTNDAGGIEDDLMVANRGDHLFAVVNAARADADIAHLRAKFGGAVTVLDRALVALQGPAAETALARLCPDAAAMRFMDVATLDWDGTEIWAARAGYTGEDGFEISLPQVSAEPFARALLEMAEVRPAGLGARDSLRMEAGLPLYGHDIDATTTPHAAGLGWSIGKARRAQGVRAGGFPGADIILQEAETGAELRRVGLRPEGRAPMRDGTALYLSESGDTPAGRVTSGGFGPSLGAPIAMGYLPASAAQPGTQIWGEVRGKRLPAVVTALPFHPHTYKR